MSNEADTNTTDTNTSRFAWRKLAVRIAMLLAIPFALALNGLDDADAGAGSRPVLDVYYTVEDTTDDQSRPDPIAECLLAQGWRGDPTDGAEAIYAPTPIINACFSVAP